MVQVNYHTKLDNATSLKTKACVNMRGHIEVEVFMPLTSLASSNEPRSSMVRLFN